ncbi:hypothetical protein EWM64_g4066 [Hericium alpestre]|uniref:Zn(2)-C6 fungal-type domain-containing protein n=1 Tax=Hericium alpestre TaxID=135208 RepID=A0A4Y9ZYH7_9AGAM|nr:hypothetical protein EWM64_g4066 [Hericium alpestre]
MPSVYEPPLDYPPADSMADSLSYTPSPHYSPYYGANAAPADPNLGHVAGQPQRSDSAQRRRPKYTRSKTGCMTCRVKKIKVKFCDETKPNCVRCVHGQRECTWPEGVPTKRKTSKKSADGHSVDGRPSTAGSSGLSESSTPPTRDNTPPIKRERQELGLPSLVPRRHSEPYMHTLPPTNETGHRNSIPVIANGGSHYTPSGLPSTSLNLSSIPEMPSSYGHSVDNRYSTSHYVPPTFSRSHTGGYRSVDTPHSLAHWQHSSVASHADPIDSYYPPIQERGLVQPAIDNHVTRYP